ncbi:MAG: hypothetical protein HY064_14730 [Bacteroidetes bacterium]|nr:hypothetical protein [Bacteroidota bacterium]
MKKSALLVAALAFGATTAFAQLENKKGETYLPESGDWSIGIDATPVLNYMGNLIGGNGLNVAPTWNFLNANQTIIGKMYTSDQSAYRGIVRIGMDNSHSTAMIGDATQTTPPTYPTVPTMKTDEMKASSHFVGLGAGMEMRKGKTRLQGFYGADFMFWMSGSKDTYTYGNALAGGATPIMPSAATTTNFGSNMTTDTYGNAARITSWKSGSTIGFGLRGFIGAEYFIIPKVSIGAEFGWGIGFSMTGASTTDLESVGGAGPAVGTQTWTGGKSGSFMLDTDRNAFASGTGALRLNFHFQ